MKIISVVGARPNFMKVSALERVFSQRPEFDSIIVHTGQHFDAKMSDIFFDQLELKKPDYYLGIGGGSHAEVTAKIMIAFEKVVLEQEPDMVLVVGDINSTIACALVASKLHIKIAHVEAGLRSGDRKMPEEINRILTDSISDLLFVTEESGMRNLENEGVDKSKVYFVGNVMIDSVVHYYNKFNNATFLKANNLDEKEYILMTMHRPSNVDNKESLSIIIEVIKESAKRKKVVFPMHPRTKNNLERFGLLDSLERIPNLIIMPPLGYIEFLSLVNFAAIILTDSGGIQEESTYLGIPCLTLRDSTERPVTIDLGTNILVTKLETDVIIRALDENIISRNKLHSIPPLWDGNAADRIAEILLEKNISND